jgi:hypothetical protein
MSPARDDEDWVAMRQLCGVGFPETDARLEQGETQ